MQYYQTFVKDASYKSSEPLTYATHRQLARGSIVLVPLKQKLVPGFVVGKTIKPKFATKPIHTIFDLPPLPAASVQLAEWLLYYYPSSVGVVTQHFLPQGLSVASRPSSDDVTTAIVAKLPKLTTEQQGVVETVAKPDTYLLHGETGSGKTRVYIELTARALTQNRSAVILTPEIGLTPQLAENFIEAFGEATVMLTHSQLTEKQRRTMWLNMLTASKPIVVVGPRSALFAPIRQVGLIVLDESHEPTYKQDQLPHYHAGKIAAKLAELHKATLILGSATPSVVDYFTAQQKRKLILRMSKSAQPIRDEYKTKLQLIDIKQRADFSRSSQLSDFLIDSVERSLQAHEQSLLFLNRRGTARTILCELCGWQALCPRCNLPLTYHGDLHTFQCHTCGFRRSASNNCPVCSHTNIILKNVGTKAIVDEVTSLFPHARVVRFDADNKKHERLEQQYSDVRSGKVDILVGTQLLAKGLDLPKLSTVGVVLADSSLSFPDYTSAERTYQLLRQVIGRVGRGHRSSRVFVQTYEPSSLVLRAAARNDWSGFYERELSERKQFMFPPFCFLLKLTCRRATAKSSEKTAQKLKEKLETSGVRIIVEGPSPSFREKIGQTYEWQLIIKARNRGELLRVVSVLPSGWSYDIDPLQLL